MHRRLRGTYSNSLVHIAQQLATNVLATCLLVVEDAGGRGEDDLSERTGGKEQVDPVLDLGHLDVEARGDDARLVEAAVELNDDLAGAVVVDDLEVANVACRAQSLISTLLTDGNAMRRREGMSSP